MKHFLVPIVALAAACTFAAPLMAADTVFVPPSDTTGSIWSTNTNDGYNGGRGVVFTPTAAFSLTNVALYQNLTNVTLSYTLRLATASSGQVGGGTILSSGSQTVTTNGLEFIDFALSTPLTLNAGTYYFLDFTFNDAANQNFFFNQLGAEPYSQAGFAGIDGTSGGSTSNFVLPEIRLSSADAAVPEPASWAMFIGGFGLIGGAMRRRKATVTFA